jgi:hypothetical protein
MAWYTLYDAQTGIVRNSIAGIDDAKRNRLPSEGLERGQWSGDAWYFPQGVRTPRPQFTPVDERTIRADGRHETSFSSLPAGTTLRVDRQNETGRFDLIWESFEIDDGSFQFSTAQTGYYRLRFAAPFPHREQDVMVTANAP